MIVIFYQFKIVFDESEPKVQFKILSLPLTNQSADFHLHVWASDHIAKIRFILNWKTKRDFWRFFFHFIAWVDLLRKLKCHLRVSKDCWNIPTRWLPRKPKILLSQGMSYFIVYRINFYWILFPNSDNQLHFFE